MWTANRKLIDSGSIQKISVFNGDQQIIYSEVIELWQHDHSFRSFFISLLTETPMTAYFWETPPISQATVNKVFEFVLVNSPRLFLVHPNQSDFKRHFASTTEAVTSFPNLGKDALLIVPCPIAELSAYPHLASFVRKAPQSQQHLLWQTVGYELQQRLTQQPIWVSTSGLGVYWLHIRLDSSPKYYTFKPYKSEV